MCVCVRMCVCVCECVCVCVCVCVLFQPAVVDPTYVAFESYLRLSLHTEMKVATGFPEFVPSSVLEDPSYSRRQNKVHIA